MGIFKSKFFLKFFPSTFILRSPRNPHSRRACLFLGIPSVSPHPPINPGHTQNLFPFRKCSFCQTFKGPLGDFRGSLLPMGGCCRISKEIAASMAPTPHPKTAFFFYCCFPRPFAIFGRWSPPLTPFPFFSLFVFPTPPPSLLCHYFSFSPPP